MSEPLCFVVMRNGHIMPPGIHMHRANADATAAKEEGEVVPLYKLQSALSSLQAKHDRAIAALQKVIEQCDSLKSHMDNLDKIEREDTGHRALVKSARVKMYADNIAAIPRQALADEVTDERAQNGDDHG